MVLHSFSAVKARDELYASIRPNWIVIHRLRKLFRYLADNAHKFHVRTMGDLAKNLEALERGSRARAVPNLGLLTAASRKAVQLINNIYWV